MKLNINFKLNFDFRYSRGQQLWILLLAIVPGVLAYYKHISSTTAGLLVLLLYYVSKRHAKEMQLQYDKEERARQQEERRLAALPAKARKNIEKRKLKQQLEESRAQEAASAPDVDLEESKKLL